MLIPNQTESSQGHLSWVGKIIQSFNISSKQSCVSFVGIYNETSHFKFWCQKGLSFTGEYCVYTYQRILTAEKEKLWWHFNDLKINMIFGQNIEFPLTNTWINLPFHLYTEAELRIYNGILIARLFVSEILNELWSNFFVVSLSTRYTSVSIKHAVIYNARCILKRCFISVISYAHVIMLYSKIVAGRKIVMPPTFVK